jgi:hypothetical protein
MSFPVVVIVVVVVAVDIFVVVVVCDDNRVEAVVVEKKKLEVLEMGEGFQRKLFQLGVVSNLDSFENRVGHEGVRGDGGEVRRVRHLQ